MHVLVTADTLTGVWTYARELVTGLVSRNARVTLVSVGEIPLPHETAWMDNLHGLEYIPTAFRLDWMQEGKEDLQDSSQFLVNLIRELKPDVVHLNQLCYGNLAVETPRIVVAHTDWISWWKSVHGCDPKETRWLAWYREAIAQGVAGANVVVAPTNWMLETVNACYGRAKRQQVIYNGRNPIFFNPYVSKEESVLAVGRLWDAGKQVSLLTQHEHPVPVCIVGSEPSVQAPRIPIRADVKLSIDQVKVAFKGPQTEAQMRTLYSKAAIYAATARYEPFSMNALEAALSRCAIVANDIPSLREIWDDTAFYFHLNSAASLADAIRRLGREPDLCRHYATLAYQRARDRFTAKRMIDEYFALYQQLIATESVAA